MKNSRLSQNAFERALLFLVDRPITHVGQGEGQAVFLEVGLLRPSMNREGKYFVRGEVSIVLKGGWRVERAQSVWFGALSDQKTIESLLPNLLGRTVDAASCAGRLPELSLTLSGALWLRSFFCQQGPQRWSILHSGHLYRARGPSFYREEEGELPK